MEARPEIFLPGIDIQNTVKAGKELKRQGTTFNPDTISDIYETAKEHNPYKYITNYFEVTF